MQQTNSSSNRLNQVTGFTETNIATQVSGSTTLSYDLDGNLTSQGNSRYGYDDADRLTSIVRVDAQTGTNVHKSEFLYDGLSRKRMSREYEWVNGAWELQSEIRRIYDGMNVVQERDGNNAVTATYTRGQDMGGGIGGLLARSVPAEQGTSHFYYHYDGRGNVTQLTDANQTTVARYTYDAFGNTSATGSQGGQPYRFSTKEYHSYSGLYDYGYRFYSPSLGRWINRDPIQEDGGLNLYGFVENNPVTLIDLYGNLSSWAAAGIGAGLGAAGGAATGLIQEAWRWLVVSCHEFDWHEVGQAALGGAVAGGVTGGILGVATGDVSFTVVVVTTTGTGAIGGLTEGLYDTTFRPRPAPTCGFPSRWQQFNQAYWEHWSGHNDPGDMPYWKWDDWFMGTTPVPERGRL